MGLKITPKTAIFVIFSFEGPDPYSQAGGLGTRINNLAEGLAGMGFESHLFFIGDPDLPAEEPLKNGKYILHRWCQWISRYHPNGVYDGEDGKVNDYSGSVPHYVLDNIAKRAAGENKSIVVMAEEWHTVEALCYLSELLHWNGLRDRAVFLWNANNTMSFHRINWGRLTYVSKITAVSKFMKQIMANLGIESIVVPNGIPERMLQLHNPKYLKSMKNALARRKTDLKLLKIGRFDPAKRWVQAIEAAVALKGRGVSSTFFVRGGLEPHGAEVLGLAHSLGLSIADVTSPVRRPTVEESIAILANAPHCDILNLKFFLPEELVRLLYHTCDCVFANSGFEPFGLVGLEVMASGGIAFTGATGEDYVVPFVNAISVETSDPREIVAYLEYLNNYPEVKDLMKSEAYKTAAQFTWPVVINNLIRRIEFIGM
jgi:glycosyltransferase involved in cell wall biosynthesis